MIFSYLVENLDISVGNYDNSKILAKISFEF